VSDILLAILTGLWAGIEFMVYVLGWTVFSVTMFVLCMIFLERRG
jgi:hypothetical protein